MKFLLEWFTFGKHVTSTRGTTIHAFIPANRIGCYEEDLKAGVIYKIKNFLVINNKTSYKVTSHKFLIQFTHHTVLAPTDHAGHDIERQNVRIRSYAEFNEAVNKNEDLYDALGKLVLVSNENFNNGVTNKRIDIHLQLKDGPIVRVTLWGNVAANFQKKLMESVDKPMVLLATTMNPRTFRDVFCLSSTSSTRIFFDNDIEPNTGYLTWLRENGKDSEVTTSETRRVRYSRRRKAVATEERRIKAMRDQPLFIVFPYTSDWVLCFT
ncbi:unnamed protein product [Brassica oleracea]